MNQIYSMLLLFMFVASCTGQSSLTSKESYPKLVKPTGTDSYTSVRCSLQDKAGNIWFGTTGAGVYRYDGKGFTNFTVKDGLSDSVVFCMAEDHDGVIWIGTEKGVCRFDGNQFSRFAIPGLDTNYDKMLSTVATGRSIYRDGSGTSVYSMVCDQKGNLWLGTGMMGLYKYDGVAFTNYRTKDSLWSRMPGESLDSRNGDHTNAIQYIMEDRAGHIWFSALSHPGVYRMDGETFTNINPDRLQSTIFYMLEDKAGNVWLGSTENGVCRYDGKSFTYFSDKDGLCNNNNTSIMQDRVGNIWFGSTFLMEAGRRNGCVTKYDGKSFTRFPVDSLGNSSMWNLFQDKTGHIWLGGRNVSLYRYDGKTLSDFSAPI